MAPVDRIVGVVGPTASGKSRLAVELAQRLGNAEIVNADSMQLYRGMDIGTAKPTADERSVVPHHLFDVLDVTETASSPSSRRMAREHDRRVPSAGESPRSWSAVRRCTYAPCSTGSTSRAPTRRCGSGGRLSSRREVPRRCTPSSPGATPRPPRTSCRTQRSPHRPCARGHRAHRRTVRGDDAAVRVGVRRRHPDRARRATRRARRTAGRTRRRDVGRRASSTRYARCARSASSDGFTASRALGYQQILAFLRGETTRGRSARGDGHRHPQVRPSPGPRLPQGPPHPLAPVRRRRPRRPSASLVHSSSCLTRFRYVAAAASLLNQRTVVE